MSPCVTPNTTPTGSRSCSQRTRGGKAPAWAGLRGARRSEASSEGRRGFSRSQSITASMARSRWKATRPKRDGTCLCLARRPPEIRRAHYMLRSDTSRQCAKRHFERNRRPLATRAPRIRLAILARCRAEGRPYGGGSSVRTRFLHRGVCPPRAVSVRLPEGCRLDKKPEKGERSVRRIARVAPRISETTRVRCR